MEEVAKVTLEEATPFQNLHKSLSSSPHLLQPPSPPEAGLLLSLVHPVQGETVEEGGVLSVAAHAYELPFPVLIGLLEDGEDGPPSNPIKAYP